MLLPIFDVNTTTARPSQRLFIRPTVSIMKKVRLARRASLKTGPTGFGWFGASRPSNRYTIINDMVGVRWVRR